MSSLNLHQLALEVFAESVTPDPGVMAAQLIDRIPKAQHREALEQMARQYMRVVVAGQRQIRNGGSGQASRKVDAARNAWKRLLDTPEFIPSAGWIFLRDATREQVIEMSRMREQKATELTVAAARYRSIAEAMKAAKVGRVADLPGDVLERHLGQIEVAS